jgi:hypothetical protein
MGPLIKSLGDFIQRGLRRLNTESSKTQNISRIRDPLITDDCLLITQSMAGGRGFEPRLMGPEPIVLPLNDPPTENSICGKSDELSREKQEFTAKSADVTSRGWEGALRAFNEKG